jgi:hypothetical protein
MLKNGIGNRVMVRRKHSSALSVTGGAGRPEVNTVFLYSKRDLKMQQENPDDEPCDRAGFLARA